MLIILVYRCNDKQHANKTNKILCALFFLDSVLHETVLNDTVVAESTYLLQIDKEVLEQLHKSHGIGLKSILIVDVSVA